MKFRSSLGAALLGTCSVVGCVLPVSGLASAQQTHAPQTAPPAPDPSPREGTQSPSSAPNAKVIFSRSATENSAEEAGSGNPAKPEHPTAKAADAERSAVTYTSYDLDIRLRPEEHALAVEAQVTIRNDGAQPLKQLPLQLSSTLHWETIESAGHPLPFGEALLKSDADHTGEVREAVVALTHPLEPKGELRLKMIYSGQVELTAQRLVRIGTPDDVARHSDWDQVAPEFVGLRGFGNVLWYPTTSVPVLLGDGARLFTEIGHQKQRQAATPVTLHVTAEFYGDAPNLAVLDGHVVPVTRTASPNASFPGVVTCNLSATALGFSSPNLFLLSRAEQDQDGVQLFARPEDQVHQVSYLTAASESVPLLKDWLGSRSKSPLVMVDLADPDDVPFEVGNVLLTGMGAAEPAQLAGALSHAWGHAYFHSSRAWLDEGVAEFVGNLWVEKVRGHEAVLERMEATRGTLALAEPADPGAASGEPLIEASDTTYYRAKAAYVLWMLRDLAGDTALSAALRAYSAADDTRPEYFQHLLEQTSGKKLQWFFDSWVYQDRGLPDLSIANVFPARAAGAGQYLVAVDVSNDGYVETEVPVTVRSQDASATERVHLLPRSKTTHRFLLQGMPTEVSVNDGTVPEVQASIHQQTLTVAKNNP